MDETNVSLTKFEYPALLLGSPALAGELEGSLQSEEVQEHVQRAFYLDVVDTAHDAELPVLRVYELDVPVMVL